MSTKVNNARMAGDDESIVCPKLSHRELLQISEETECNNYWFSDNSFPESTAIRTEAKELELRKFMSKRVSPIAFSCPCKPGEPIDVTRGGTVATIGFAYYKNWVSLDPCEVAEEVVCLEDDTPFERVPYAEKYRRHVAAKTAALTEAVRTRYELMATFIKLWGSYVVTGPKMDSVYVDFRRNPCLTVVLKRNYDDVNTFPMEDLIEFDNHFRINSTTANGRGGKRAARYTFGVDAWYCFSTHHQVIREGFTRACDCTEPENDLGIQSDDCGIEFAGRLNNVPVYVDSRTYIDDDMVEKFYMPQDALLIEAEGMGGRRAHSTVYSPAANFQPGDFFFREFFCEPDEVWTLEVQGSINMFPEDVNCSMLVRNVGRVRTFPGCACEDRLLNAEGSIVAPPGSDKGLCGDSEWEVAQRNAVDNDRFAICAVLLGRTPPRTPCHNVGATSRCVPGKMCQISPAKDPCPSSPKKCITKQTLLQQGFDELGIAEMLYFGGLEVPSEEMGIICGKQEVVTPSLPPAAATPEMDAVDA